MQGSICFHFACASEVYTAVFTFSALCQFFDLPVSLSSVMIPLPISANSEFLNHASSSFIWVILSKVLSIFVFLFCFALLFLLSYFNPFIQLYHLIFHFVDIALNRILASSSMTTTASTHVCPDLVRECPFIGMHTYEGTFTVNLSDIHRSRSWVISGLQIGHCDFCSAPNGTAITFPKISSG